MKLTYGTTLPRARVVARESLHARLVTVSHHVCRFNRVVSSIISLSPHACCFTRVVSLYYFTCVASRVSFTVSLHACRCTVSLHACRFNLPYLVPEYLHVGLLRVHQLRKHLILVICGPSAQEVAFYRDLSLRPVD